MWHRFLVNKFKNERRTNDHNVEAVAKKREYLKSLKDRRGNKEKKQKIGVGWGCPNFLPPNQPEDDEKAVKQLKAQLKAQARKKKKSKTITSTNRAWNIHSQIAGIKWFEVFLCVN